MKRILSFGGGLQTTAMAIMIAEGGFAALNSGLFFLGFIFSLFLMTGWERLLVSVLVLGCWMYFATYTFIKLKQEGKDDG